MSRPSSVPPRVARRPTPPRRRLAVGGLLRTSALAAGVLLAAPADAADPVSVTDAAALENALQSCGTGKGTGRLVAQGASETRAGKVTVKNAGH